MSTNWTREELIIAFNLYCKIPFAKSVKTNPDVIRVAELIGRTPSAVAFKLGNFGSFDPELKKRGIGGLPNTSRLDRMIWDEFNNNWDELAFQSENLMAERSAPVTPEFDMPPEGLDRTALVKVRVNQNFFRQSILAIYSGRCCITGLAVPDLLVASHIVPWKSDVANRTNPRNGLCLNPTHDRAFDRGYITVGEDFRVIASPRLRDKADAAISSLLLDFHGMRITLPDKFLPDPGFLKFHNENIFRS